MRGVNSFTVEEQTASLLSADKTLLFLFPKRFSEGQCPDSCAGSLILAGI